MCRLAYGSTADSLRDKIKEQHKARVTDPTSCPEAPVDSQALLSLQTLYIDTQTDVRMDACIATSVTIKNTNALWVLQAVAIHSTFCQMSLMQGH